MKQALKFLSISGLLFMAVALFSFNNTHTYAPDASGRHLATEDALGVNVAPPSKETTVLKGWNKDTITNAANDTLTVPSVYPSAYQYCTQIRLTNISGTRSIKFYLEQVATPGSTRYMKVDSAITSGSTVNDYMMKGANLWGYKYRIIVDGSGTQSTAYQVDWLAKKTAM